jgi:hypothetical protein
VVEVARLESVYRFIAYRGFESPSLRQEHKCEKGHPRVAFLHLFHGGEKQSACALCEGDSKASRVLARAAPNRPSAIATRWRAGGAARSASANFPLSLIVQLLHLSLLAFAPHRAGLS